MSRTPNSPGLPGVVEKRTGGFINVGNVNPDDVRFYDVCFALSNLCRWTGHCRFYSVAEHCINVSRILSGKLQLFGFFHDAAEAYINDISTPLKALVPEIRAIERFAMEAIIPVLCGRMWTEDEYQQIKQADKIVTSIEAERMMKSRGAYFDVDYGNFPVDNVSVSCMLPSDARHSFVLRYRELIKWIGGGSQHDEGELRDEIDAG